MHATIIATWLEFEVFLLLLLPGLFFGVALFEVLISSGSSFGASYISKTSQKKLEIQ